MTNYTDISNGQRIMCYSIPDPIIEFPKKTDNFHSDMYLFLANATSFYQNLMLEMGYEDAFFGESQKDISTDKEYISSSVKFTHKSLPKAEIKVYCSYYKDKYFTVDTVLTDILFDDVPRARIMVYTNSTHGNIKINKVEHGQYIIHAIRNHWSAEVPIKLMPASQLL